MAKETNIYYNIEDLVTVKDKKGYYTQHLLAVPCNKNKYYIFEYDKYVPCDSYIVLSNVSVDPISIIKNENKLNETRETYNLSPVTLDGINCILKTLSNHQDTLSDETYIFDKLYVFKGNKDKSKHICFKLDEGGFYNILKKKLIDENKYEFLGRLDLLSVKFNHLFSGLFYLDEKDVKVLEDTINDPKHLIVDKDSNGVEKLK